MKTPREKTRHEYHLAFLELRTLEFVVYKLGFREIIFTKWKKNIYRAAKYFEKGWIRHAALNNIPYFSLCNLKQYCSYEFKWNILFIKKFWFNDTLKNLCESCDFMFLLFKPINILNFDLFNSSCAFVNTLISGLTFLSIYL